MTHEDFLLAQLDYRDGVLYWKTRAQGRTLGKPAGCVDKKGYVRLTIFGEMYFAHRLVWLMFKGGWPVGQLDHINRKPADNRIENLRESNTRDNNLNKKQSERVLPHNIYEHHGKYRVDILYKGTRYKSKAVATVKEALEARGALLLEAGLGQ